MRVANNGGLSGRGHGFGCFCSMVLIAGIWFDGQDLDAEIK